MSSDTQNLNGGRSFDERVFARFDAMDMRFDAVDRRFEAVDKRFDGVDSAIADLNVRVESLEAKSYDTKPIWERALREIVETRRDLSKRLDRIESIVLETRVRVIDAEDRIEKLESK